VVLLLDSEQVEEGRQVIGRPRPQVPIQELAELRDRVGAARQQIVVAVAPCRASHDRPRQPTRLRAPRRETHQRRQRGEAGREHQIALEDQPVPQLHPCLCGVLALDVFQQFGDTIDVPATVVHLCPVHHLCIQPFCSARPRRDCRPRLRDPGRRSS
jgi:hypothetical protein